MIIYEGKDYNDVSRKAANIMAGTRAVLSWICTWAAGGSARSL